MTSSITQADITNLERALVSGELQVRIGDRWITYRSIEEIKVALDYARGQVAAATTDTSRRTTALVVGLSRGVE